MPRPDLELLGIQHRRIPVVAIGRDVYVDTRLILAKLEATYPAVPRLDAAQSPEHRALQKLLEVWTVEAGLFERAAALIPATLPLTRDPAFRRDRLAFNNGRGGGRHARPEAVVALRAAAAFLETTLLADGRAWVLATPAPSLADVEAVWPFHWLTTMPGALPPEHVSPAQFPRLFAWVERFGAAVRAARRQGRGGGGGGGEPLPPPTTLSGETARAAVVGAPYHEAEGRVDERDPCVVAGGLAKGRRVTVFPTDSGSSGKDVGRLVSLDGNEVVIETQAGDSTVRLHAPRHGFRVSLEERAANL